jgi:predicted RNA binding protein YcfA (HicA-like mRNA interferase family)
VPSKLPQLSGKQLLHFLEKLGYINIRQKGSHIRLRKTTVMGEHNITIPNHKTIAIGTLNDILTKVGLWNNLSREELIKTIKNL